MIDDLFIIETSIILGKYKNMANDEVGGIDIFLNQKQMK